MHRRHIYYNGKDLADFGVYVAGYPNESRPQKDYSVEQVPGRNGDIYISNKRFKNILVSYPVLIIGDKDISGNEYMDHNLKTQDLFAWLARPESYVRLEDSYDPDVFRAAIYIQGASVETLRHMSKFELEFECKPQRFAKIGEQTITLTSATTLRNPYLFDALPILRVYGYGYLHIGPYVVQIAQHNLVYIDIDCERQDAYKGARNCNPLIAVTEFPKLGAGDNTITFDNTITRVDIMPRWWTL